VYPAGKKVKEERAEERRAEVAFDCPRDFSSETDPARFGRQSVRRFPPEP
jgi:hypothetical protein